MKLRVIAIGSENVMRRISASLSGSRIEIICRSDVPQALSILRQTEFDLVLVDSYLTDVGLICDQIMQVSQTPVVLITNSLKTDWKKLRILEVNGFVSEDAEQTEIVARLMAIARRHNHRFSGALIFLTGEVEPAHECINLAVFWPKARVCPTGQIFF
jgi:DNA-binding response OmpR family regulator